MEERQGLISRQQAIDVIIEDKICDASLKIMTAMGDGDKAETLNMACDRHAKMLMSLPPAQPEHQWIPCSGTTDIPHHEVLCCDRYGEELIGWLSYVDNRWLCESDGEMIYDPIAWREKPKPYREETGRMTDTEMQRRKAICDVAGVDDIGELSDGFHTFNQLYYQRMMLFATIVKQNRDRAWKSLRHEDKELCFGGGWFIVGIDTPEGSYTYHYEDKYFSLFDCEELECGKHWDGHTEKDVTRLLSLPSAQLDMTEKLYLYKCYITDKDGLQHEVIHTGDIRRVTGWEI